MPTQREHLQDFVRLAARGERDNTVLLTHQSEISVGRLARMNVDASNGSVREGDDRATAAFGPGSAAR